MRLITAALSCFLALAAGSAVGQPTGHSVEAIKLALKSPISEQVAARARQQDDEILRSGSMDGQRLYLVTDSRLDRTKAVMAKLLGVLKQNPNDWTVRVLDTNPKIENAFVSGRNVYVYTGLLQNVQSEDELGFILSHEIGHTALHQQERKRGDVTQTVGGLIELGAALSKNQDKRDRLGLVGGAIKASYSRVDEQEADAFGVYLAGRAGYNPLKGANFFARMMREGDTIKSQNDQQIATDRATINAQLANCQRLRNQWNANPLIRTRQNEQIVNSTCQAAEANAQRFNAALSEQASRSAKGELLRTHPADNERIAAIAAAVDFFGKRRPLESLKGIGGGYNVYVAMAQLRDEAMAARARACETDDCRVQAAVAQVRQSIPPPAGYYAAASRESGETCNSNSDCAGSLRCQVNVCTAD